MGKIQVFDNEESVYDRWAFMRLTGYYVPANENLRPSDLKIREMEALLKATDDYISVLLKSCPFLNKVHYIRELHNFERDLAQALLDYEERYNRIGRESDS